MVYIYVKQSELNKYIGKELTVQEIENTLSNLGMDIKGNNLEKDPELKIEITAEKMDMISALGIGRAIKYYLGIEKNIKEYKLTKSNLNVIVENSVEKIRPKIVCAIIKNVPMNEEFLNEMIKIQEKIHDSFGRNRKKAAIGIYPLEKVKFPIYYKAQNPNQIKFKPLGMDKIVDAEYILNNHETGKKFAHLLKNEKLYPILEDSNKNILSMPPIINSEDTGKVNLSHKDLFIECTGLNLKHLDNILKVLITTFIDMGCIGESVKISGDKYPNYELKIENTKDNFNLDYINKIIGIKIDIKNIKRYLNQMQFKFIKNNKSNIQIEIPPYRSDIWNDCDIADDIARAYGYNNIKVKFPNISSIAKTLEFTDFKNKISTTLISAGFLELYTYMLTSTTYQFQFMNLKEEKNKFIKLNDSAEDGINMIRTLILPENLRSLHINRKNKYPQKIFENGFTIQIDKKKETKTVDETHLCISIADPKSNYTNIKEIIDLISKIFELKFEIKKLKNDFLIEGRSGKILFKNIEIGFIGELHPKILENFKLLVPISTLEINLLKIFELKKSN